MRISNALKEKIVAALTEQFGQVGIILYGSRTDDSRKGGDYDIAIDSQLNIAEFNQRKAKFLAQMIRAGYDLPFDLVQLASVNELLRNEISQKGITLCPRLF